MKISSCHSPLKRGGRLLRAYTLNEMTVAVGVMSLMSLGIISMYIFVLKYDQLVHSKLGSSDQARRALSQLVSDVRGARIIRVGNGSETTFVPAAWDTMQRGTALHINLTPSTNTYIRYYYNTNAGELRRMESNVPGYTVVANCLTNQMFFQAEDYRGNVLYDGAWNYVIRTTLQFYQYQYPLTKVGPGNLYDFYKMEFKVTRRAAN